MRLVSLTQRQCGAINTLNKRAILLSMRFNCNMPDAAISGIIEYGGMDFLDAYTLHDQLYILDLLGYLRWDNMVANNVLVWLHWTTSSLTWDF